MPASPPPYLHQHGDHLQLRVKVVPNSSRTQLAGTLGDSLKIKVAQPAESGKANKAVLQLLAETLGIAAANITLVSGQTNPQKIFHISGITLEAAAATLAARG